ncbi:sterol carrier protein domain-containing protein [Lysinibacillus xylanilyticus]|nr:sterol carrier protein domain-containing protein [Lysinibacillus xylanilyticus]
MKRDSIQGYMVFSFSKQSETNFLLNNLVIKEWIYETPEALLEFSTFLNSQVDQVNRIEWNIQEALIPSVYHASAVSGVGLLYRIINEELTTHNFNGQTLTFKLTVKDSLLAENNQQIVIEAIDGNIKISISTNYDVEMVIDIAELSSLVIGVVTVQELFMLNKVRISDGQYVQSLHHFFFVLDKPTCITAF